MRYSWITGSSGVSIAPVEARSVWGGPRPIWMVGHSPGAACRTAQDGQSLRLAVVGPCYATDDDLRQGLAAVRSGDWRALTRWPGSYWVVADDGQRAVVLTDVAGTRGVYFTFHGDGVVWATAATPLADLTGASVDYSALTARLTCPTCSEVTGTATVFVGVHRLPGGHALHLGPEPTRTSAYESLAQQSSFADAAEALREALLTAVDRRVAGIGRLSADFSGGLDSTSLALLAARTGRRLLAVTRDDPTSANDDVEYARRAAATTPNMEHQVIAEPGGLFFDDLDCAPYTDQPHSDAARWAMRHTYHRQVIDAESQLHLTGSGGDTLLVASPYYLADLVRVGGGAQLLRHATARARLRHLPVRSVLTAAVRLSLISYPQALRRLAEAVVQPEDRWRRPSTARLGWASPATFAAWLAPSARTSLAHRIRAAADSIDLGDLPVSTYRAWCELREFGAYQAELTAQLEATGVPAHAPLLDNEPVRAAMGLPVADRQATTQQKPLLGAALQGLVPDFLLHRPTKGAYDGNAYTGLRRNAPVLRDLLARSYLAAAGAIDITAVHAELDRMVAGAPGRLSALETLITTELWLQQHAARSVSRHTRWLVPEMAHV